jgi:acyl dehydratase
MTHLNNVVHPGARFYEDINVGDIFLTPGRTLTDSDIFTYAGISGDFHAYHTNDVLSQEGAFKGRICHGPLTLGILSGLFRSRLGLFDGTSIATLEITNVKFVKPVRPNDTIRGRVTIISKRISKSRPFSGIVDIQLEGINQHHENIVSCKWIELVKFKIN